MTGTFGVVAAVITATASFLSAGKGPGRAIEGPLASVSSATTTTKGATQSPTGKSPTRIPSAADFGWQSDGVEFVMAYDSQAMGYLHEDLDPDDQTDLVASSPTGFVGEHGAIVIPGIDGDSMPRASRCGKNAESFKGVSVAGLQPGMYMCMRTTSHDIVLLQRLYAGDSLEFRMWRE